MRVTLAELETVASQRALQRLLADTDVFLTLFKPEVLKNLGLDHSLLQQRHYR